MEAYLWATLSADQGRKDAKDLQAAILKDMMPGQVYKAQRLAQTWKVKVRAQLQKIMSRR